MNWKELVEQRLEIVEDNCRHRDQEVLILPCKGDFVECEKCGCLIWRKEENKGKPEIRQKIAVKTFFAWEMYEESGEDCPTEDYLYYPYYCKRCRPKEKK